MARIPTLYRRPWPHQKQQQLLLLRRRQLPQRTPPRAERRETTKQKKQKSVQWRKRREGNRKGQVQKTTGERESNVAARCMECKKAKRYRCELLLAHV